ncbi:MAG: hypothetical protein GC149_14155 [Gammaproteobacteria bacterium]|nr:hypothetical protein [Gammaproteobacteria bacterium]
MDTKQDSSARIIDYMAKDYDSLLASMKKVIPQLIPEWKDYDKQTDFGHVLLQLFAHAGDVLSYYQDRIANEAFLTTAKERRSVIQHLKLISYRLATATPAAARLQITIAATYNGVVRIRKGDAFATPSTRDSSSIRYEYTGESFDLDCSTLAIDSASGNKLYEIDIEQGKYIREDVLGTSDGSADQTFALNFSPLILRPTDSTADRNEAINRDIQVWMDLGGVIDADWRLQESLAFSLPGAKDFTLEIDENDRATLRFGGGDTGAAIPSGAVVKASYRTGGGASGNVSAGTITTLADAPALNTIGATVTNPDAATGGSDRETIEHAVANAPKVFRSQNRAVTAEDYRVLALKYIGEGKVRAVATHWNEVTLYVAPPGGGRVSDVLRENLIKYFFDKRPISTNIEVDDVEYVKIYIDAEIGIESYYSRLQMTEKIQAAVADLLDFNNVDFGEIIYVSKFYEAIEKLDGVTYVIIADPRRDGVPSAYDAPGKIKLRDSEIPRLPGIDINDPASDQPYVAGLNITRLVGGY